MTACGAPKRWASHPREQAAEGRHAHERHGVEAHHAAAFVVRRQWFAGRCCWRPSAASCQSRRRASSNSDSHTDRDRTKEQASAEQRGRKRNQAASPRTIFRVARRRAESALPRRRSHQEAEGVRAAVQHARGEDGHQNGVRHPHQADQREQQKDGADGTEPTRSASLRFNWSQIGARGSFSSDALHASSAARRSPPGS